MEGGEDRLSSANSCRYGAPDLRLVGLVGLLYLIFYYVYFLRFPLSGSFIGSTDAILHTNIFYEHYYKLLEWLGIGRFGYAFYPEGGIMPYMEFYMGQSALFWLAGLIGAGDLWANHFMVSALYALNGFSVFLLAYHYTGKIRGALLAGFIFSSTAYMLGNYELLNGLAFFFVPLALYFTERYRSSRRIPYLYGVVLCLGAGTFFSLYFFLIGSLLVFLFLIPDWRRVIGMPLKQMAGLVLLSLLVVLPTVLKLTSGSIAAAFNPISTLPDGSDRFSLTLYSLISSMPGNLIYPSNYLHYGAEAMKMDFKANPGVVVILLVFLGVLTKVPRRGWFILLSALCLVLSLGSRLSIGQFSVRLPLYWLYQWESLEMFFRIPARFYTVTLMCFALLAAWGYQKMEGKLRGGWIMMTVILALVFLENLEWRVRPGDHRQITETPKCYGELPVTEESPLVLANLPSSLFTAHSGYVNGVSEFSREYRYHYWQTRHKQHIINGSASYFPQTRMANNALLVHLLQPGNLDILIDNNDLDYIVWHRDMILSAAEQDQLPLLETSDRLVAVYEDERNVLFRVK